MWGVGCGQVNVPFGLNVTVVKLASYLVPMATAFVPGEGSCTYDLGGKGGESPRYTAFVSPDGSACNLERGGGGRVC